MGPAPALRPALRVARRPCVAGARRTQHEFPLARPWAWTGRPRNPCLAADIRQHRRQRGTTPAPSSPEYLARRSGRRASIPGPPWTPMTPGDSSQLGPFAGDRSHAHQRERLPGHPGRGRIGRGRAMGGEDRVRNDREALTEGLSWYCRPTLLCDPEDLRPYECDGPPPIERYRWRFACRRPNSRCATCWASAIALRPGGSPGVQAPASPGRMPHPQGVVLSPAASTGFSKSIRPRAWRWCSQGAQSCSIRSGSPLRSLLRARSFVADRLHPGWQCGGKFGAFIASSRADQVQRRLLRVVTIAGEVWR